MAELFRKAALERLSSPEQLDKAITVSKPVSWLALIGITIIIVAFIAWLIFNSFPVMTPARDPAGTIVSVIMNGGQAL